MRYRLLNASSPLVLFGRFATVEIHVVQDEYVHTFKYSISRVFREIKSAWNLNHSKPWADEEGCFQPRFLY